MISVIFTWIFVMITTQMTEKYSTAICYRIIVLLKWELSRLIKTFTPNVGLAIKWFLNKEQ